MSKKFLLDRSELTPFVLWVVAGAAAGYLWPLTDKLARSLGKPTLGELLNHVFGGWTYVTSSGGRIMPIAIVLVGMLLGAVVAIPQWLLLRSRFSAPGRWAIATLVGGVLAAIASNATFQFWPKEQHFYDEAKTTFSYLPTAGFTVAMMAIGGAVRGLCQFFVLRHRIAHAGFWPVITVVAGAAGVLCPPLVRPAVLPLLTGYTLFLLLRQPVDAPHPITIASSGLRWPVSYGFGWLFVALGVVIKLVGAAISRTIARAPHADSLVGLYQNMKNLNTAVTVEATSDILMGCCFLGGVFFLVRTYLMRRRQKDAVMLGKGL